MDVERIGRCLLDVRDIVGGGLASPGRFDETLALLPMHCRQDLTQLMQRLREAVEKDGVGAEFRTAVLGRRVVSPPPPGALECAVEGKVWTWGLIHGDVNPLERLLQNAPHVRGVLMVLTEPHHPFMKALDMAHLLWKQRFSMNLESAARFSPLEGRREADGWHVGAPCASRADRLEGKCRKLLVLNLCLLRPAESSEWAPIVEAREGGLRVLSEVSPLLSEGRAMRVGAVASALRLIAWRGSMEHLREDVVRRLARGVAELDAIVEEGKGAVSSSVVRRWMSTHRTQRAAAFVETIGVARENLQSLIAPLDGPRCTSQTQPQSLTDV